MTTANNKYELTVNEKYNFPLTSEDVSKLDIADLGAGKFHLLKNGQSYLVQVVAVDRNLKTVMLSIGQEMFEVKIADSYDQLIAKMGLDAKIAHQINDVKAPMPGLVLSVEVVEGQTIEQGQPLLILEAMKMENVLKSPGNGRVKTILAEKGKSVEKGHVLLVLE